MPQTFQVDAFVSFTLAIMLLFAGKGITQRLACLRRYSIPEPVIGGFLCAALACALYYLAGWQLEFELGVRDILLLYFFAGIGLKSEIRSLLQGGRPLLILLLLAAVFILLQNALGMTVASGFGLDPRAGLMLGSISLTGGAGTTLAWAPTFVEQLGIGNALELGIASNTLGMVSACIIGGPIASYLIRRHRLETSHENHLMIGTAHDEPAPSLDYYKVLWAWMWLNLALLCGYGLDRLLSEQGLMLPQFVSCLLAGILIRNLLPYIIRDRHFVKGWKDAKQGLALISDICLGMFLTMTLMGLQLWQLQGVLGVILVTLALQILLTVAYILFVVFRLMGRNYEASVICAGFGGISLGSTATAIVNMTAVTQQYGAARQAFIIVPLVCGFFIDLFNALVIGTLVG